ncbi:hypothetical protein JIN84_14670 [Luteolibacter yonseiensis]|uniref:Uncharacterized protein n=1 Tax=Luteolibacter yonseiensis TaxID=1144680 RepID=A0A934R4A4_9BACT|nr:hypothetical protein [Luteolibacter yonseiensis]MBK1816866.1 hypothetical protein [Luteolibacter yonseiensis]
MKKSPMVHRLCLLALPALVAGDAHAATRGREPWAFRMILENKTRMLVLALRSDLWASYNPANGTLHKVWNGGVQFQGKVWDFSQKNSVTLGTTYHQLEDAFVFRNLDETVIPAGWTSSGVTTGGQWSFGSSSAVLTSPALDLTKYGNVMLNYFTPGSGGVLRVQVSNNNGATWDAQYWDSLSSPPEDGNQKQLAVNGSQVRLRFIPTTGASTGLQNVSLFGDYQAWSARQDGSPVNARVDWRGYQLVNQTDGIVIKYDIVLPGDVRVAVHEAPEALAGAAMTRKFTVSGLPAGAVLSLELDGTGYNAARTLSGAGALRTAGGDTFLDFTSNGECTLNTTWTP